MPPNNLDIQDTSDNFKYSRLMASVNDLRKKKDIKKYYFVGLIVSALILFMILIWWGSKSKNENSIFKLTNETHKISSEIKQNKINILDSIMNETEQISVNETNSVISDVEKTDVAQTIFSLKDENTAKYNLKSCLNLVSLPIAFKSRRQSICSSSLPKPKSNIRLIMMDPQDCFNDKTCNDVVSQETDDTAKDFHNAYYNFIMSIFCFDSNLCTHNNETLYEGRPLSCGLNETVLPNHSSTLVLAVPSCNSIKSKLSLLGNFYKILDVLLNCFKKSYIIETNYTIEFPICYSNFLIDSEEFYENHKKQIIFLNNNVTHIRNLLHNNKVIDNNRGNQINEIETINNLKTCLKFSDTTYYVRENTNTPCKKLLFEPKKIVRFVLRDPKPCSTFGGICSDIVPFETDRHTKEGFHDIYFNFLIGTLGDTVYEGRPISCGFNESFLSDDHSSVLIISIPNCEYIKKHFYSHGFFEHLQHIINCYKDSNILVDNFTMEFPQSCQEVLFRHNKFYESNQKQITFLHDNKTHIENVLKMNKNTQDENNKNNNEIDETISKNSLKDCLINHNVQFHDRVTSIFDENICSNSSFEPRSNIRLIMRDPKPCFTYGSDCSDIIPYETKRHTDKDFHDIYYNFIVGVLSDIMFEGRPLSCGFNESFLKQDHISTLVLSVPSCDYLERNFYAHSFFIGFERILECLKDSKVIVDNFKMFLSQSCRDLVIKNNNFYYKYRNDITFLEWDVFHIDKLLEKHSHEPDIGQEEPSNEEPEYY